MIVRETQMKQKTLRSTLEVEQKRFDNTWDLAFSSAKEAEDAVVLRPGFVLEEKQNLYSNNRHAWAPLLLSAASAVSAGASSAALDAAGTGVGSFLAQVLKDRALPNYALSSAKMRCEHTELSQQWVGASA